MAYQCGMIDDSEGWLALLESRNVLAHTYSEEKVMDVIGRVKAEYVPLFERLRVELGKNWI